MRESYKLICCPRCGSDNLRIIEERNRKDYDLCSGILGAICLGPVGMLCGLCGAEGETRKTTYICNDCGAHFRD